MRWPAAVAVLALAWLLPLPLQARGLMPGNVFLRVMATSVPVHSGPGGSYSEIGRVGQGQVYPALDRSPDGAWYRIRLARGISGWVLSELVWPFEIAEDTPLTEARGWMEEHVLGDAPLGENRFLFTLQGGTLDTDGLFVLRAGYQASQHWVLELSAGESPSRLGNMLFYQAELLVALGPWRTVVPFVAVGGGGSTTFPGKDVKLFTPDTHPLVSGGGGILLALQGVTLRVDVRRLVVFSQDENWGMLAITGGAMLSF